MVGVGVKQFQRTYPGDYKLNFPICLSASNDFKTKNYSNFYLTNNFKFSDFFSFDNKKLKIYDIKTTIKYGEDFLKFVIADPKPYA